MVQSLATGTKEVTASYSIIYAHIPMVLPYEFCHAGSQSCALLRQEGKAA